jgi:hypothetical protein
MELTGVGALRKPSIKSSCKSVGQKTISCVRVLRRLTAITDGRVNHSIGIEPDCLGDIPHRHAVGYPVAAAPGEQASAVAQGLGLPRQGDAQSGVQLNGLEPLTSTTLTSVLVWPETTASGPRTGVANIAAAGVVIAGVST